MLAAINVCAALELLKISLWNTSLSAILSGVAALYAAGLTVAGNVENFFNRGEQAAGFRETRDLYQIPLIRTRGPIGAVRWT
jgi:hypothetical protein